MPGGGGNGQGGAGTVLGVAHQHAPRRGPDLDAATVGATVAAGAPDDAVRLRHGQLLVEYRPLGILTGHEGAVKIIVAFSPDGHIVATGSDNNTARLWEVHDPHHPHSLSKITGHFGKVRAIAFNPDGRTLAIASESTVRLWEVNDPHRLPSLDLGADHRPLHRRRRGDHLAGPPRAVVLIHPGRDPLAGGCWIDGPTLANLAGQHPQRFVAAIARVAQWVHALGSTDARIDNPVITSDGYLADEAGVVHSHSQGSTPQPYDRRLLTPGGRSLSGGESEAMSSALGTPAMSGDGRAVAAVRDATTLRQPETPGQPARFALILKPAQDPVERAAVVAAALAPVGVRVMPLSTLDQQVLVVEIAERSFGADSAAAFAAAHALEDAFDLEAAEPDLPTDLFPEPPVGGAELGIINFPFGCQAPREAALDRTPMWALDAMRVPQAWAFSVARQRPDQGDGVIVAQPDTGITRHVELDGISSVPGFDVLDNDPDPTDPLAAGFGDNPGHGTGTASVVVSLPPGRVTGSAPRAQHMAIRAIESVIRITQVSVAQAMDWATDHGAHVITLSLGGLPSPTLFRALQRAVQGDVIVLAAAGNCVGTVVWPARYDECIAVAGVDVRDARWRGSSRGASVDISAPGENVFHATTPVGSDQGQGTSYSVALTAGVAALWLAHHGRANLIAAARARGETLQTMFQRLVGATARRPPGWDSTEMGAGIVDAQALLGADLGQRSERQVMAAPADFREATARTVESLVAEILGPEAGQDAVDWYRFGPEIAAVLLRRRLDTPTPDADPLPRTPAEVPGVSPQLARAVTNPRLRAGLGLTAIP